MSPLRGKHPGHKPYRLQYIDKQTGKLRTKSYHWRGPWEEDAAYIRRKGNLMGEFVKAWRVEKEPVHG